MEREKTPCREGFEVLDRNGMMAVEGGSLQKIVEVVRAVARMIQVIADITDCVDDFMEGFQEGLEEARG